MHASLPGLHPSGAYPAPCGPATRRLEAPKTQMAPRPSQGAMEDQFDNLLVRALRKQGHQNHQIGKSEQPLIGADAGRFRCPRNKAEVAALGKIVYMLDADSRQAGDL